MTKEEWQHISQDLDNNYREFLMSYELSVNGKNRGIRRNADINIQHYIRKALFLINSKNEVRALLLGSNQDDFSVAIFMDEFSQSNYFRNDMGDFLQKIRDKIATL